MAKAPSLQFYPGDVQRDTALSSCSLAAYGLWHRMMWVMFDGTPAGHLSVNGSVIPDSNLSLLLRVTPEELRSLTAELEAAGVFSRTDAGVIFCRRMVRDAKRRETNALNGSKGGNPNLQVKEDSVRKSDNRKPNRITAEANAVADVLVDSGKERAGGKVHEAVLWPSFDDWWNLYDKKSDRKKCEAKWARILQRDRERMMEHTQLYVTQGRGSDPQFRRDPATYLNNENWNDEELAAPRTAGANGKPTGQQLSADLDRVIAERYGKQ